ncbi:hypothetical protein PVAND_016941 [Polypedilum vanderplanki]|uniref:Uncharacterized protein n=1 Tax=Polypedilum vanderplanki TaxID=319348 RepID=A0A9J6BH96_POLVA|nr:hypothetical protein PVAND_016941 [Polypedilum vanderplanki]
MNFTKGQIFTEFHTNDDFKRVSKKEAISAGLFFIQEKLENNLTKEGQQKVSAIIKVLHNKFTKQISSVDGKIEKLQQKSDWNSICLTVKNKWICEQDKKDREEAKKLAEECGNDVELLFTAASIAAEESGNLAAKEMIDIVKILHQFNLLDRFKIIKKNK